MLTFFLPRYTEACAGGWLIISKTRGKIRAGESVLLSAGVPTKNLAADKDINEILILIRLTN